MAEHPPADQIPRITRAPSFLRLDTPNIKIMSYNIRYEHDTEKREHHWDDRKEDLVQVIREKDPDVIGFQEVKEGQLQYLLKQLPGYAHVGKPRDQTPNAEYSCIFYKTARFTHQDHYTFWLSDQPEWEAYVSWKGLPRVCTWVLLADNFDGKWFAVYNTHLEWEYRPARENGLKLIRWRMNDLYRVHRLQLPMILCGDFNAQPHEPEIRLVSDEEFEPERELRLHDASAIACNKLGPPGTFLGSTWHTRVAYDQPDTIDYIFVNRHVCVHQFEVIADPKERGHTASDHLPILADISFV